MSKSASPKNFESALSDLENIVAQMENSQLPLEQSLAAYKQGIELLRYCQQTLQDSEQQIRILTEQNSLQSFSDD
jgi:exodeoxyribonuclease VII small subunit